MIAIYETGCSDIRLGPVFQLIRQRFFAFGEIWVLSATIVDGALRYAGNEGRLLINRPIQKRRLKFGDGAWGRYGRASQP